MSDDTQLRELSLARWRMLKRHLLADVRVGRMENLLLLDDFTGF
jgi:hypothetical protein